MAVNKQQIQTARIEIQNALSKLVGAQSALAGAGDVGEQLSDLQVVGMIRRRVNSAVSSLQLRLKELEELL